MSEFSEYLAQNARLIILKELASQTSGTLNQSLLMKVLDTFGHKRSRDWVRQQMRVLADIGAVDLTEAGSVLIARLKPAGREHVEGRTILEGVETPSEV